MWHPFAPSLSSSFPDASIQTVHTYATPADEGSCEVRPGRLEIVGLGLARRCGVVGFFFASDWCSSERFLVGVRSTRKGSLQYNLAIDGIRTRPSPWYSYDRDSCTSLPTRWKELRWDGEHCSTRARGGMSDCEVGFSAVQPHRIAE